MFLKVSFNISVNCKNYMAISCRRTDMGQWCNDTYKGEKSLCTWRKTCPQCHIVHHKTHRDWRGIELRLSRWEPGDWTPEPWYGMDVLRWLLSCSLRNGIYRGAGKSLTRPGRKQATATEVFLMFIFTIYNHNWRNIITIYVYIYITRLVSNEIFSPSNKIHREVGRAKGLSLPL